jgi:hypothetical protein
VSLGAGARPVHPIRHAGLANLDAKLEKLAMNSLRSPEWIGDTYLADQLAYFQRHRRPAAAGARFPGRCHLMPVSGFTIAKASSTFGAKRYKPTNARRSSIPNVGRFGDFRRNTLS